MKFIKKTDSFLGRYSRIVPVSKALSPVFTALCYVSAVSLALLLIIALITVFVNVPVEEMLLPPHMKAIKDSAGTVTSYSLNLGSGIKIITDAAEITLSHIKTVIYCRIGIYILTLAACTPIFMLLSKLFKNIGKDEIMSESNAKYINYVGMIILLGNIVVSIVSDVFNYIQIAKFASGIEVGYSFGLSLFGVIVGIFIIVLGTVYGYACSKARNTMAVAVPTEKADS